MDMKTVLRRALVSGDPRTDPRATRDAGRASPDTACSPAPDACGPRCRSGLRYASTATVPTDHQFAYWQSLSRVPRIERARPSSDTAGFYGEMLFSEPRPDVQFIHRCTDSLTWHFGWREPDYVVLARLRHGSLYVRHGRDAVAAIAPESGLVLCDRDRPTIFTGPEHVSMTYLRLPRAMVTEALGMQPTRAGEAVRRLSQPGAVMNCLLHQLDAMIGAGTRAGGPHCAASLHLMLATVMTLLAKRNPHRWRLSEAYDEALLATARCLLTLRSADHELSPEQVASMVGCSRAHLYRQFARTGQSIVETLREARLQRARNLLAAQWSTPVGTIAAQCGYCEFSTFDRAFRARFHTTPRGFRQRIRDQAAARVA